MKFADIREHYYEVTGKASDIARHLAFVGFAAIWVFREGSSGVGVPSAMIPAAIGFALALLLDSLQYGVAAWHWRRQVDRADETCDDDDDECEVPTNINKWPRLLFAGKLWSVGLSYAWYIGTIATILVRSRT